MNMVSIYNLRQNIAAAIEVQRVSLASVKKCLKDIPDFELPSFTESLTSLREIKHSLFHSLYSLAGSSVSARSAINFLDHEICTSEFSSHLGVAVLAGIPAGFMGRAASQGFLVFVGNNALGRVVALVPRLLVTHFANREFSSYLNSKINHEAYKWNDAFSEQDVLALLNLGFGEVLGHSAQALARGGVGGFILGRLIGGGTNCLGNGLEIYAGQQLNRLSRHFLHRRLFDAVEGRDVWRDALNVREFIKNSVMDTAFCAGHGVMGILSPQAPLLRGQKDRQGFRGIKARVESPRLQDFAEFYNQRAQIARATGCSTLMLIGAAVGDLSFREHHIALEVKSTQRTQFLEDTARAEARGNLEEAEACMRAASQLGLEIEEHKKALGISQVSEAYPVSKLMKLVSIQGGQFSMGAEDADAYIIDGVNTEAPVQEITLPDFQVTESVVTNATFDLYVKEMQARPYAIIATEKENPYCWVIGRFESEDHAQGYLRDWLSGDMQMEEFLELGRNNEREREFFLKKQFDLSVYQEASDGKILKNPTGLQVKCVVPQDREMDCRVERPNQPATNIRWYEALGCADWLGRILSGFPGRLPLATESEFVRRGGIDPETGQCRNWKYGTSDGKAPDGSNADFNRSFNEGPKDVDAVPVNSLGVRINGVWEWCNGWYQKNLKGLAERIAGFMKPDYNSRELRGVSWDGNDVRYARAARRSRREPDIRLNFIGFRCVVVVPQD